MPSTRVDLQRAQRPRIVPAPYRPTAAHAPAAPPIAAEPEPQTTEPSAALEIVLPNGRVVRAPTGFVSADLERVLAIASGEEPPQPPEPPRAAVPPRK